MCGICGFFHYSIKEHKKDERIDLSVKSLAHRGPDDSGIYNSKNSGLSLGHTRLSIVDLSSSGHQPFQSFDGNFFLVFNGEIYNYEELRNRVNEYYLKSEKKFFDWKGQSDTEVLLEWFIVSQKQKKHITDFLNSLEGIFAFAIWDEINKKLLIARDSFGVKPLYFSDNGMKVSFSSEIRALSFLIKSLGDIDYLSIKRYLTYLWCPGDGTPLTGVKKLSPGEYLIINKKFGLKKVIWGKIPAFKTTNKIKSNLKQNKKVSLFNKKQILIKQTEAKLRNAVHKQLISDVEIGAFLSGGLDSSSIVKFAKEKIPNIRCFTIDNEYDSSTNRRDDVLYAREVAKLLNLNIEIVKGDHNDLVSSIEDMILQLEEPLADPACLNVYYISKIANEYGIKVLLSGTGGDDLFTGYRRHLAVKNEKLWTWLPVPLRYLIHKTSYFLPNQYEISRRVKKLFSGIHLDSEERLINYFSWIDQSFLNDLFTPSIKNELEIYRVNEPIKNFLNSLPSNLNDVEKILALEQRFFLSDHNLIYTDKMSMKAGVEVRVPFLDSQLVNFVANIPTKYKIKGFDTKWILKKTMEQFFPKEIIYRPKVGFGAPLRSWINFELKEWTLEILSNDNIKRRGIFDPLKVEKLLKKNFSNEFDYTYTIFCMICIEIWCKKFIDKK